MFKKFTLIIFLASSFVVSIYPTKKENTQNFYYCYALEKLITKNSIKSKKKLSPKFKSISKEILKIGINETRGDLINNIIYKYKNSKNSIIFNLVSNNVYCLGGYWLEIIKPGIFESIFYKESQKKINQFKELKDEVDLLINDMNSEYKIIKEELLKNDMNSEYKIIKEDLLNDINKEYENIKKDFNNIF